METRAAALRRDARFIRRTAKAARADGQDGRAARLYVLASELERAAKNRSGQWWITYHPDQPRLFQVNVFDR